MKDKIGLSKQINDLKSWYSGYFRGTSWCLMCSLKCAESLKLYQKYTDFTLKTLFRVKLESLSTFRDFFFFLGSKVSWKIWIFPVLGVCLFESMAAVTLTYYWWVETYNLKIFLQNHLLWYYMSYMCSLRQSSRLKWNTETHSKINLKRS